MKEQRRRIFKHTILMTLSSILLTLLIFSCDKYQYEPPTIDPGEEVTFQDVLGIFEEQNCAACHPGVSPPDLSPGNAYESLMDGYVNTDSPEQSLIYTQFEDGHVGLDTNSIELQSILNWINQGAPNN